MKIVGNFAIICWDLLSNSDDEGRVGIKRLITRNQFVDNTTRGFESLPLRQEKPKSNTMFGLGFCFAFSQSVGYEHRVQSKFLENYTFPFLKKMMLVSVEKYNFPG